MEDSDAETDMNVVMSSKGEFVELQGTAEGKTFSKDELASLIELANHGCDELFNQQKQLFSQLGIELNL